LTLIGLLQKGITELARLLEFWRESIYRSGFLTPKDCQQKQRKGQFHRRKNTMALSISVPDQKP
jgi:hypothetical protein